MRPVGDSPFLTPDERLYGVADILAAGVLRLHAQEALSTGGRQSPPVVPWPATLRRAGSWQVLDKAEAQLSAGLLQSGLAGNLLREIDGADRRPDAYEMAV